MTYDKAMKEFIKLELLKDDKEVHHIEAEKILVAFLRARDPECAAVATAFCYAKDSVDGWWYA